jgi:uncharacterized membrane protein required for colicin V production
MTLLDWALVVLWAGIALAGFFKGVVRIVFGVGGLALGVWLAVVIGPDIAAALGEWVHQPWLAVLLAWLIPPLVVAPLCLVAGWGLERALEGLKLGCLNRGLGMILAGAVAAVTLAVLLVGAVRLSPGLAAYEGRSALLDALTGIAGRAAPAGREASQEAAAEQASPPTPTKVPAPATGGSSGR